MRQTPEEEGGGGRGREWKSSKRAGKGNRHLTATILLEGVAIVTEAAELAVLALRVVQALEAPPGLLVTGFWVRRVDVVVTPARLTRAPHVQGIAKEARGTVVASGACCPIKPAWDLRLAP